MVAAELRDQPYVDATQLLIVANFGVSIARNVKVTFDPEIPDPPDPTQSVTQFLKARYAAPIAVMTPGMELDNIYFSGRPGGENRWTNGEPTPAQVVVTIAYENDAGDKFVDQFPLDTEIIRNRTYTSSSKAPEALMKDATQSLKGLYGLAEAAHRDWVAIQRDSLEQASTVRAQAEAKRQRHDALVQRLLPHKRD